jgi:hypothetical protein
MVTHPTGALLTRIYFNHSQAVWDTRRESVRVRVRERASERGEGKHVRGATYMRACGTKLKSLARANRCA